MECYLSTPIPPPPKGRGFYEVLLVMSERKYCGNRLTREEVEELNRLLLKNKLDLPLHRRVVDLSGRNYDWLKKNLSLKNPDVSGRLKELLGL